MGWSRTCCGFIWPNKYHLLTQSSQQTWPTVHQEISTNSRKDLEKYKIGKVGGLLLYNKNTKLFLQISPPMLNWPLKWGEVNMDRTVFHSWTLAPEIFRMTFINIFALLSSPFKGLLKLGPTRGGFVFQQINVFSFVRPDVFFSSSRDYWCWLVLISHI